MSESEVPQKILAVRVGRVGDTVMMTPALRALIDYYPGAGITLLTSPVGKLLLKDFHPNVREIWTWNRSGLLQPARDKRKLLSLLKANDFDRIICFDTSPRIARLFTGAGRAFDQFTGSTELKHCAKAYLDFLADICHKPVANYYNWLPVSPQASAAVAEELAKHGITGEDRVLMIHPTFSGYSPIAIRKRHAKLRKLWHPENYGQLAIRLKQEDPTLKIMMVLLPDELSFGEKIVQQSKGNVLLLKSESSFDRYKAMIKRADVMLTPDSGPMHLASALDTKVVAFFSMKDPGDCGPYMDPERFTILRSEDTATPEKGINAISVDSVLHAVQDMLAR
jgi:ADP-heptose:LPS heptosyltransferase